MNTLTDIRRNRRKHRIIVRDSINVGLNTLKGDEVFIHDDGVPVKMYHETDVRAAVTFAVQACMEQHRQLVIQSMQIKEE